MGYVGMFGYGADMRGWRSFVKPVRAGLVILVCAISVSACQTTSGPYQVSRHQMGRANEVLYGTVVDAHTVQVRNEEAGLGAVAGAVVGGAFGSTVGGGTPENLAVGIAGAIAGGVLGHALERGLTDDHATEYVVQTDHGETLTLIQGNDVLFAPGQRVMMVYGGGVSQQVRLVPAQGHAAFVAGPPAWQSNAPSRSGQTGGWHRNSGRNDGNWKEDSWGDDWSTDDYPGNDPYPSSETDEPQSTLPYSMP